MVAANLQREVPNIDDAQSAIDQRLSRIGPNTTPQAISNIRGRIAGELRGRGLSSGQASNLAQRIVAAELKVRPQQGRRQPAQQLNRGEKVALKEAISSGVSKGRAKGRLSRGEAAITARERSEFQGSETAASAPSRSGQLAVEQRSVRQNVSSTGFSLGDQTTRSTSRGLSPRVAPIGAVPVIDPFTGPLIPTTQSVGSKLSGFETTTIGVSGSGDEVSRVVDGPAPGFLESVGTGIQNFFLGKGGSAITNLENRIAVSEARQASIAPGGRGSGFSGFVRDVQRATFTGEQVRLGANIGARESAANVPSGVANLVGGAATGFTITGAKSLLGTSAGRKVVGKGVRTFGSKVVGKAVLPAVAAVAAIDVLTTKGSAATKGQRLGDIAVDIATFGVGAAGGSRVASSVSSGVTGTAKVVRGGVQRQDFEAMQAATGGSKFNLPARGGLVVRGGTGSRVAAVTSQDILSANRVPGVGFDRPTVFPSSTGIVTGVTPLTVQRGFPGVPRGSQVQAQLSGKVITPQEAARLRVNEIRNLGRLGRLGGRAETGLSSTVDTSIFGTSKVKQIPRRPFDIQIGSPRTLPTSPLVGSPKVTPTGSGISVKFAQFSKPTPFIDSKPVFVTTTPLGIGPRLTAPTNAASQLRLENILRGQQLSAAANARPSGIQKDILKFDPGAFAFRSKFKPSGTPLVFGKPPVLPDNALSRSFGRGSTADSFRSSLAPSGRITPTRPDAATLARFGDTMTRITGKGLVGDIAGPDIITGGSRVVIPPPTGPGSFISPVAPTTSTTNIIPFFKPSSRISPTVTKPRAEVRTRQDSPYATVFPLKPTTRPVPVFNDKKPIVPPAFVPPITTGRLKSRSRLDTAQEPKQRQAITPSLKLTQEPVRRPNLVTLPKIGRSSPNPRQPPFRGIFPPPRLGGGGGGFRLPSAPRAKQQQRLTPSFTALAFNLKGSLKAESPIGFSGLSSLSGVVRPIPKRKKKKGKRNNNKIFGGIL